MKAPDLAIGGSASARIPDTTGWERDRELGRGMGQAAISCSPSGNGGVALIINRWSVMLSISQIRSVVVKDVTGREGVVHHYLTIEWGRAAGSEPLPPFAEFNIVSDDAVEFARLLQEQRDLRKGEQASVQSAESFAVITTLSTADDPLVSPTSAVSYFPLLDMIGRPWLVEVVVDEDLDVSEGVIVRALEISDWDRQLRDQLVPDGQINAESARHLLDEFLETREDRLDALDDLRPHQDVISVRIAEESEVP